MSADLNDTENVAIGAASAVLVVASLQPTIYLKNAAAQGLPLTMNPRVLYRGVGVNLVNEMGQLSAQFGVTGSFKKHFPKTPAGELGAAASAGALVALYVSPCELLMVQQQKYGGSLFSTGVKLFNTFGVAYSLGRGLQCAMVRDGIMVCGMLGATPVIQDQLQRRETFGKDNAAANSLAASMLGGIFGALLSHPFDVLNTCVKGDLEQKLYKGVGDTARALFKEGGVRRFFGGGLWRTINITCTVWIANECALRMPEHVKPITRGMFGMTGPKKEGGN
jgi:hypothetical protein